MRDIELYGALLGLTVPWTVAGVDVDMIGQRVGARGRGRTHVRSAGRQGRGMTSNPVASFPHRPDVLRCPERSAAAREERPSNVSEWMNDLTR